MGVGYLIYCAKCKRDPWVIEYDDFDSVKGFSCEYCSSLGQLDMQQIACQVLTEEQIFCYTMIKEGFLRQESF